MVLLGVAIVVILIIAGILFYTFKTSPSSPSSIKTTTKTAQFVANQLLIEYQSGYSPQASSSAISQTARDNLQTSLKQNGVVAQEQVSPFIKTGSLSNFYVLEFPKGKDIKTLQREIKKLPGISSVGFNYYSHGDIGVTPNDSLYPSQRYLKQIRMPEAWAVAKPTKKITVAIVDSGLVENHEDIDYTNVTWGPNLLFLPEEKFENLPFAIDNNGHGTAVAGIIAAITNNKKGVSGIGSDVQSLPIKVLNKDGIGKSNIIANGIALAAYYGAQVINVSITANLQAPCTSDETTAKLYRDAIDYANEHGSIVVTSAGNEGRNVESVIPASCPGVIVVGAINLEHRQATFRSGKKSNWGDGVDVSANGVDITTTWYESTVPNEKYFYTKSASGTSFSAPQVAATAALLLGVNPSLTPEEVEQCIKKSGHSLKTVVPLGKELDVYNALLVCGNAKRLSENDISSLSSCSGEIVSQCGVNNVLKISWDMQDVHKGCNVFVRDSTGDHQISTDCTSNNYPDGVWAGSEIPGSGSVKNNGHYKLYISNGGTCYNVLADDKVLACKPSVSPTSTGGGKPLEIRGVEVTPGTGN